MGSRAIDSRRRRSAARPTLCARLGSQVTLETRSAGKIVAIVDGYAIGLGTFGAAAAKRVLRLRTGLPLVSLASGSRSSDKELTLLLRRLAQRGFVEYRLPGKKDNDDLVVIEPQTADYWPQTPQIKATDYIVLSRFAYMRRRGNDLVLESPRAAALFRICDAQLAAAIAALCVPQQIGKIERQVGFPRGELLALLIDCRILFKINAASVANPRAVEGDDALVLWDFHDLLFHARSSEGRHANPSGGTFPFAGVIAPLPALRPRWHGGKIDLSAVAAAPPEQASKIAELLRQRHSTRAFDALRPITLAELARFLDSTARVLSTWSGSADLGDGGPAVEYAVRPYPSAGAAHELELYLAVDKCAGLARGFYHYDAGGHVLVMISASTPELEALLTGAASAMGAPAAPQIVITVAARFGRISWKYSSLAYSLVLKDVGVLLQTFYLASTDIGLGGCAIGVTNIELFAKLTGMEFHVEGPVGQFAIGRAADELPSPPGAQPDRERS